MTPVRLRFDQIRVWRWAKCRLTEVSLTQFPCLRSLESGEETDGTDSNAASGEGAAPGAVEADRQLVRV